MKTQRPYKLAFDARPAQGNITGVTTYSINLIKHFSALDDEFNFIFIVDSNLNTSHIKFPKHSEYINTSIGRGGSLKNWILRDYFNQFVLPRKLLHMGTHIYHQPDYCIPIRPVPFVTVATFLDAIIFTPHDYRSFLSKARDRMLIKKGGNIADAIVTISDFSKRELVKYLGIDPCKITRIWCGISDCFFNPVKHDAVESCYQKLGFDRGFIFYYGGFGKRKNVELLLHAYKIMMEKMDIKLVLAGNITRKIERNIKTLGLWKSVINFGFAHEEELKVLLNQCSAFVFPSSMEGFGLPVAEAMACGAPVVCSDNGSLPEIAGSAVQYFEKAAPEDLAIVIRKVLDNSNLREHLKCQSRLRAQEFRWSKAIDLHRELYLELIEKKIHHKFF